MPRIIVIGGHTRNIGKTQLVVEILRAFADKKWLAAKITQFGHGICSVNGEQCGCADDEHTVAVDVETDNTSNTDTARFLQAGAERVLWVRTKQGRLAEAMPQLRKEMEQAENVILESNAVLGLLQPDVYLPVLDFSNPDFKDTARAMLDRATAYVIVEPSAANSTSRPEGVLGVRAQPEWEGVSLKWLAERPVFRVDPNALCPPPLVEFIREQVFARVGD